MNYDIFAQVPSLRLRRMVISVIASTHALSNRFISHSLSLSLSCLSLLPLSLSLSLSLSVSGFLIGLVKYQNTNSAVHHAKQVPLILYRPKKNLLALFATGVSNAHVSLVVICSFAKAPAAALRLNPLMIAPLSPAHPGQMPLSGMKAKCIALLIKLVRHPSQHPPVQPARYTSTVLEARRLSSLAPLSVKTRLPDLSRSM